MLLVKSSKNVDISGHVWLCAFIIHIWCYCMVWFRLPVGTAVCNLVQATNGVWWQAFFSTIHELVEAYLDVYILVTCG